MTLSRVSVTCISSWISGATMSRAPLQPSFVWGSGPGQQISSMGWVWDTPKQISHMGQANFVNVGMGKWYSFGKTAYGEAESENLVFV